MLRGELWGHNRLPSATPENAATEVKLEFKIKQGKYFLKARVSAKDGHRERQR